MPDPTGGSSPRRGGCTIRIRKQGWKPLPHRRKADTSADVAEW